LSASRKTGRGKHPCIPFVKRLKRLLQRKRVLRVNWKSMDITLRKIAKFTRVLAAKNENLAFYAKTFCKIRKNVP
jgi:hypothetical protein